MTDNVNPQPITLILKPSRKEAFKNWCKDSLPILGIYAVGMVGLVLVYKNYTDGSLAIEQKAADERTDLYYQALEATVNNGDLMEQKGAVEPTPDNTVKF